ncbi:MAG: translation initiation factor IF-2, partial [Spirochaetaceae bacterium]|nr:translation initiation factor IF-2 [Spirochaetaceae bacterium]
MADDQEKQKPKTTLIKHRKDQDPDHGHDDSDRKKVRVVVRRKAKPKPDPAPSATVAAPKDAGPQPAKAPPKKTEPEIEQSPRRADVTVTKTATSERVVARADVNPPKAPPRKNPFTVSNFKEPPPSVRESVRLSRGTGQPSTRGPRTDGSRPQTQGRDRPAGGRPSGPRPGGPLRSFRGPRPAGPPRPGGAPRPGGGPPPAEDKKPAGKKFYKAKKQNYARRDRQQEKEIQYKQRKMVPKANPVPKSIDIMEVVTVSDLAKKMNLKASELIAKLMGMGMMVTINQQIDSDTATLLAEEYGCKVNLVSLYDETLIATDEDREEDLTSRSPVVTVMGHVDHGKTKLLDAIRSTNVVSGEYGGITQHIGAYQVALPDGTVTFLDTPGHEAFTLMRARGAQITDIVVLVVAADDGVMPQTREAIDHARAAKVPIIVAINKTDLANANPDRVKQQLSDLDLMPEDWGGSTLFVNVSALTGDGIPALLETLVLQAEVLELKANHETKAEGTVIESRIDPGRGTVATVLVRRGTLKIGDSFVAGIYPGKVRSMYDDHGKRVLVAGPSMPVEVLGSTGVPEAGDPFQVTENEKLSRQIGDKRQELKKVEEARNVKKITLENLYDSIQEGEVDELNVVIKGDVHGSVEALQSTLEKLSTSEIRLSVIRAAAGAINQDDVILASASDAIVIGFHVRPTPQAQQIADQEKVEIR